MNHRWKNVLVRPISTLKEALEKINSEALRVALVIDDEGKLKGVVSDGDVRRALLRGVVLDDRVSNVMNTSPTTVLYGTGKENIVEIMNNLDILFVPVVDKENVLVGLETLHDVLIETPKYENPIFLMAGGFGTRLKPLTDTCPKPMLEIGGKPMLETVIRAFIKAGFVNFYISTHYMPERIRDYFGDGSSMGVRINYVHEDAPLGTGGALGLLPDSLPENLPLIMMNGDILTKVDFQRLLEFHLENGADATMCVREYDYQIPYGVVNGEGNKITSMVEKPIQRFFVNAGIYVVSPIVVKSVPKNYAIDMPTLLEQHMHEREKVLMFPIHEYWLDIGRMDDFNRAQVDIYTLGLY